MSDLNTPCPSPEQMAQTTHDDAAAAELIEGAACFFVVVLLALAGYLTLACL